MGLLRPLIHPPCHRPMHPPTRPPSTPLSSRPTHPPTRPPTLLPMLLPLLRHQLALRTPLLIPPPSLLPIPPPRRRQLTLPLPRASALLSPTLAPGHAWSLVRVGALASARPGPTLLATRLTGITTTTESSPLATSTPTLTH